MNKYFSIFILMALIGCTSVNTDDKKTKNLKQIPKTKTEVVNITETDLLKFYTYDSLTSRYSLLNNDIANDTSSLKKNEIIIDEKAGPFSKKYSIIKKFTKNGYHYKLILALMEAENDGNSLHAQLNSYDSSLNLVDMVLLDKRLIFESYFYNKFTITDSLIKIKSYEIPLVALDEDGYIIDTPPKENIILYDSSNYRITNTGLFLKVK